MKTTNFGGASCYGSVKSLLVDSFLVPFGQRQPLGGSGVPLCIEYIFADSSTTESFQFSLLIEKIEPIVQIFTQHAFNECPFKKDRSHHMCVEVSSQTKRFQCRKQRIALSGHYHST